MPNFLQVAIAVGFGGFLGALARHGVSEALNPEPGRFPWGTLLANLAGCLLIGIAKAFVARQGDGISPFIPLALITGFMGAFTTFSTFSFEAMSMWRLGNWRGAVAYVSVSVLGGLALVVIGSRLAGAP